MYRRAFSGLMAREFLSAANCRVWLDAKQSFVGELRQTCFDTLLLVRNLRSARLPPVPGVAKNKPL